MPPVGHNLNAVKKDLEMFLKRVEKLVEDRKAIQEDIREVKKSAKEKGIDIKTFNECLKLRALDSEKRSEQEELRDMYLSALGLC